MRFYLNNTLLFLFLLSTLLLGGYIVGPYSIRIYVSVIILGYLILYRYRFPLSKEVVVYSFYILIYFIALIFNGEINQIDFFKYFFGRYFICFIAVYVISSLVKSEQTLNNIILLFIGIGVLNGIVSFLQFNGNSFAIIIPKILNPTEIAQQRLDHYASLDSGLSIGVVGLFGNIAKNGYFAATFAMLSLLLYIKTIKKWQKSIMLLIAFFLFYVVFLTQQRFVFFLLLCFYIYFLINNLKIFYVFILLLLPMLAFLLINNIFLSDYDFGRISNLRDQTRLDIFAIGFDFVKNNIYFGGQNAFSLLLYSNNIQADSAHNVIFNAFIYSGFMGGITIIFLFSNLLKNSLIVLFRKENYFGLESVYLACSFEIYLLNSLTHNSSLVTGDEYIWILYMLLTKSIFFDFRKRLSPTMSKLC